MISCINDSKNYFENRIHLQIKNIKSSAKNYCISIGLDFDKKNPIRTEMYHRCKLELIKQAKVKDPLQPYQIYYNKLLIDFIIQEKNRLNVAIENLNRYRNNIINKNDHDECVKRGYKNNLYDPDSLEFYYACRKSLISDFVYSPEHLRLKKTSYSSAFVINKNQDQKIKNKMEFELKYPHCSSHRIQTKKAKECMQGFDQNISCRRSGRRKSILLKMEMNKVCQERLYSKIPQNLLLDEDGKKKYTKKNYMTDLYLNPSLHDFMKNNEVRESFQAKSEEEGDNKIEEDKEDKNKINNSNRNIYDRKELVSLRRNFIIGCTSQIETQIKNFIARNDRLCDSKIIKWKK